MPVPIRYVCNWNITHDEDKFMDDLSVNTWPLAVVYKISHGICPECQSVVREEIKTRAKERI